MLNDEVVVLVGGDVLDVVARIAGRDAKGHAVLSHEVHGANNLVERAVTAATVVGGLEALERHREHDVAQALAVVAELLVDERAVGEEAKDAVVVLLGKADDVLLAHQGLTAGHHEEVRAQRLGLGDQAIHVIEGEVEGVAVVGGPAADAVLVAGTRGVEDDDPGHVALVLLGRLGSLAQAAEGGLVGAVQDGGLQDVGVNAVPHQLDEEVLPLGTRVECLAQGVCHVGRGVGEELAAHVQELVDGLLGVIAPDALDGLVDCDAKRLALSCVRDFRLHGCSFRPVAVVELPSTDFSHLCMDGQIF